MSPDEVVGSRDSCCNSIAESILKYALELQGYGAPNGHTDADAAKIRRASLS